MKKFNTLLLLLFCFSVSVQAQRYVTEQFSDVNVETDVVYATNISILTGMPAPLDLTMDVYTPAGDTETGRACVMVFHTGNFLPVGTNGSTTGAKNDFTVTEIATRLAKLGYVAVVPTYRQGWLPLSEDLDTRVNTLINAAYRGVQDSRALVRYLRKTKAEDDNPYGITNNHFTMWGVGTGGYISTASATLDEYQDVVLEKFIGPDLMPFVTLEANGDPDGLMEAPLNQVNTPGYSSEFSLSVNMGGALGDLSWLDEGDIPMISYHTPGDPFAPYDTDLLIVPTTGDLIVEVSGSYDMIERVNELGLNDDFEAVTGDPFTAAAIETTENPNDPEAPSTEGGLPGLMPFNRPFWTNPFSGMPAPESDPWNAWNAEFWSTQAHPSCPDGAPLEQCNFHVINSINNQDMSVTKANTYLDSVFGYFIPRAFVALDLQNIDTSTEDILEASEVNLQVIPNPTAGDFTISIDAALKMENVTLFDFSGRAAATYNSLNTNTLRVSRAGLVSGIYFAKVTTADGIITQKVILE